MWAYSWGKKKKLFRGPGARDKYLWLSLFFEGYLREASLPFATFDPPVGHGNTIRWARVCRCRHATGLGSCYSGHTIVCFSDQTSRSTYQIPLFPGGQVILSASAFVCSRFINLVKAKGRLKAEKKEKEKKCLGIDMPCAAEPIFWMWHSFNCGTDLLFFSYKAMRD